MLSGPFRCGEMLRPADIFVGDSLGAGCAEDVFFEVGETCVDIGVLMLGSCVSINHVAVDVADDVVEVQGQLVGVRQCGQTDWPGTRPRETSITGG